MPFPAAGGVAMPGAHDEKVEKNRMRGKFPREMSGPKTSCRRHGLEFGHCGGVLLQTEMENWLKWSKEWAMPKASELLYGG